MGSLAVGIASESHELRVSILTSGLAEPCTDETRVGLLVAQPARDSTVGAPTWLLYESGDIVLARSRSFDAVADAVQVHLSFLRWAAEAGLLPLRVRPVLTRDGRCVLVTPAPMHATAGGDRRLAARGCEVLPTTLAVVDPATAELVIPPRLASRWPAARFPIERVLVIDRQDGVLPGTASVLALARHVARLPGSDLQFLLDAAAELASTAQVELLGEQEIGECVQRLGGPS